MWRQARKIGMVTLLLLALRRLTLAQVEQRVSKAFGISGKAILVEHAELGMDVDTLHQLDICRREIEAR